MALNTKLLRFLLLLFSLFSLPFIVDGQDTSEIDFRKVTGWGDYRQCVQMCFTACFGENYTYCSDQIGIQVGCSTNKCLCGSKDVYEIGIEKGAMCIDISCKGNESDKAAAAKLMTDYCASKGYKYDSQSDTSSDSSDAPPEDTSTSAPPSTSTTSSPTTTPVDSPPTTNQDESNPTPTTTRPSTTKDDSSQTPDESSTKDQPTETPDSSSGGKKSDFGTSEIIGTVVGVVSLIFTALGVFIAWRRRRNNAQQLPQVAHIAPGGAPPPPPPMHYTYTHVVNAPTQNHHVINNSHNNNLW